MVLLKDKKKVTNKKSKTELLAEELFPELVAPSALGMGMSKGGILVPQQYTEDFDIVSLMKEVEDPDTGLIRDLKVDDRDLKLAKNYYDFAFSIIGKDAHPPWIIQMWTALVLFSEVCYHCSDKRWLDLEYVVNKVDKAMPSIEIAEHFKLLENGKCPKCKRTKWELHKQYGQPLYQELVNVLGQRSGKSSSAATKCAYLKHRYLKFPRLATLTNAMQKSTELTGTFVSVTFTKAFSLLWTPFINIINESSWFCLAEDSPVTLASGEKCVIQDVQAGAFVKTLEGEHQVDAVFDNGTRDCYEVALGNGELLVGTGSHQVRCLAPDGESLVWKTIDELQDGDLVVTE